jgi:ABC-type transport system involved in multi-copper enzyme maturation permease subunit
VLAVSAVLLMVSPLFCLFAFDKELSMIREVGLATITFAGILIAILTASLVITNEIENLTAIMLLAKPVRRSEFIIGKFAGILFTILVAFLFLSMVFILTYWWKNGLPAIQANVKAGKYLAGSASALKDTKDFFRTEIWLLAKGIYGCFLQVSILTSFAVILSTYFSLVISGIGCFAVLILGNISDYLYQSFSQGSSALVDGLARIASTLLPHFSLLNTSSLVATDSPISIHYLLLTSFYALIYIAFVLYITILIFSRREIK